MKKLLLILIVFFPTSVFATTATFQKGTASYTGSAATKIYVGNNTDERTDRLLVRFQDYNIIRFDISTIPTNATVSSATITLNCFEFFTGDTIDIGSIANPDGTSLWNDWGSSSAQVVALGSAVATYHYKAHSTTVKWSSAGASVNFLDVKNAASTNFTVSGTGNSVVTVTTMVQDWVTTPTHNAGLWINDRGTANFSISGVYDATTANRPLLTVTYTVPASQSTTNMFF